ncbi:hypothetical protein [Streptomyces uncialis]|uniref:hypothetical protein n=1 Tax=Streptomyces uncialis TaxID=1048205 RepID=UPI00225A5795|nr:hypothetical protein [Streptomyces uncialis]MCX4661615.1 hypothetical protein [Streptomyces uncialis]
MAKNWKTFVRLGAVAAVLCASLTASPPAGAEAAPAKAAYRFRLLMESGGFPNVRLWLNEDTRKIHADITGNPHNYFRLIHLREGYCPNRPSRGSLENSWVHPDQGTVTLSVTPTSKCEYTAWAEPHGSALPPKLSGWWVAD